MVNSHYSKVGCFSLKISTSVPPKMILFINNRLVSSSSIKQAVDAIYSAFLPKHTHP